MGMGRFASDPQPMESNAKIVVRQVTPADAAGLREAFDRLSLESRRRRFHSAGVTLSDADARRLASADHKANEALIATDPGSGSIVGVARYARLLHDPHVAEIAVTVIDEWQGLGIGRELVHQLLERAYADGLDEVVAYVDPDNKLVLDWLARAGAVVSPTDGELYTLALEPVDLRRAA
jgi:RimJ/RimL family protein N-acetyltransferase